MSNPNKPNFQSEFDPLDTIDEELDQKNQVELAQNALFDESMTTKEKQEVAASFREYRDQRPEVTTPYEHPDFHNTHEQFLENGSLEELALAAREAEEGQLETVAEDIMQAIEDRLLAQEKYAILDPEFGIDENHPSYAEYKRVSREYAKDLSQYLEIADPTSEESTPEVVSAEAEPATPEVKNKAEKGEKLVGDILKITSDTVEERISSNLEKSGSQTEEGPSEPENDPKDDSNTPEVEQEEGHSADKEADKLVDALDGNAKINEIIGEKEVSTEEAPEVAQDNQVKKEVFDYKEFRTRSKAIKSRHKAAIRFAPSKEQRNQARAEMVAELRELKSVTDLDQAGLRAKVLTFANDRSANASSRIVRRGEKKMALKDLREQYAEKEKDLRSNYSSSSDKDSRKKLDQEVEELRKERDAKMKEVRVNHKPSKYDTFRESQQFAAPEEENNN